jgi:dTMP kinase
MSRGLFIVLEGIDGSGTTTQCARLKAAMEAKGRRVLMTFEPTDRILGEHIRAGLRAQLDDPIDPATMALLFAADRLDHITHVIAPALESGVDVICDRYVASSLAYQTSTLPLEWVATLNERALVPDCTVFLRVSPDVALERIGARQGAHRDLYENREMLMGVSTRYEELFADGHVAATVLDSEADIEAVTRELIARVDALLAR